MNQVTVKKSSLELNGNHGKLVMVFEGPMPELYNLMSSFYIEETEEQAARPIDSSVLTKFAAHTSPRGALGVLFQELQPLTPEELVDCFGEATMQCADSNIDVLCLLSDSQITKEQIDFISRSIFTHSKDK